MILSKLGSAGVWSSAFSTSMRISRPTRFRPTGTVNPRRSSDLDIVPQRLVDNRRVFAGIGIAFMCYLAAVKPVLKNQIKRPTGERLAPIFGAVGPRSALALDPGVGKLVPQRVNRLARELAPVDFSTVL